MNGGFPVPAYLYRTARLGAHCRQKGASTLQCLQDPYLTLSASPSSPSKLASPLYRIWRNAIRRHVLSLLIWRSTQRRQAGSANAIRSASIIPQLCSTRRFLIRTIHRLRSSMRRGLGEYIAAFEAKSSMGARRSANPSSQRRCRSRWHNGIVVPHLTIRLREELNLLAMSHGRGLSRQCSERRSDAAVKGRLHGRDQAAGLA